MRSAAISRSVVRRVLVRGPNWIGDAVMSEPALSAVRRLFPQAEVSLLARPAVAELFAAHPAVDRLLVYDARGRHAGLAGKWAVAGMLRRAGFDLAILFQNAFEAAFLSCLAGIPRRYGYATDARSFLLTHAVPPPRAGRKVHQTAYYLELLAPLGEHGGPVVPRLSLSDADRTRGRQLLSADGIDESETVIGINPGSTYGSAKRWLPDRFAETADRVVERLRGQGRSARAVLVGAPGEEPLGHTIATVMRTKPVVLSGRTSIRELMAVIGRCAVFVTNDTGPMHIAAALGVPVVAVFGPTDSEETAPAGNRHSLVRQPVDCSPCLLRECPIDHRCMIRIPTEQVYEAAVRQLDVPRPMLAGVAVFLDRDGTVNVERGYVTAPEQLELHRGVAEAIGMLKTQGATVVLVTNQSAIGRGLIDDARLHAIHGRLDLLLAAGGARLDAVYYCPHHPDEGCHCRKPAPALIHRAVADLKLDLAASYMVGDRERDVDLGRAVGARTVLVTTGPASREALEQMRTAGYGPDHVADSLQEAAHWIIADVAQRRDARLVTS